MDRCNKHQQKDYHGLLQMTQKDDIVTTEVILEFHMGPEETKMVRCSLDSLKLN